ncbi:unknown protein [Seminavis robusta]|uniref:Uncharacterized protein n=1 Tax=Seminavis robusta TaxID=568900 RepID=A0A9N8DKG0_9STRA|nr:unknown protein [Seminavis robusta]|eukprot:Sro134_g063490.1 n/a (258) ;mRNA; r:58287-59060
MRTTYRNVSYDGSDGGRIVCKAVGFADYCSEEKSIAETATGGDKKKVWVTWKSVAKCHKSKKGKAKIKVDTKKKGNVSFILTMDNQADLEGFHQKIEHQLNEQQQTPSRSSTSEALVVDTAVVGAGVAGEQDAEGKKPNTGTVATASLSDGIAVPTTTSATPGIEHRLNEQQQTPSCNSTSEALVVDTAVVGAGVAGEQDAEGKKLNTGTVATASLSDGIAVPTTTSATPGIEHRLNEQQQTPSHNSTSEALLLTQL